MPTGVMMIPTIPKDYYRLVNRDFLNTTLEVGSSTFTHIFRHFARKSQNFPTLRNKPT